MYPLLDFSESSNAGFLSDLLRLYAGASMVATSAGPCEDNVLASRIANLSRSLSASRGTAPARRNSPMESMPANAVAAAMRKSYGFGSNSDNDTGNEASAP